MNELFEQIKAIDEILEQIANITTNQMAVLLQATSDNEEEELSMLEGMASYKDELITKLIEIEKLFDRSYIEKREEVNRLGKIGEFKRYVGLILEKKEKIQELEKNNMLIIQSRKRNVKKPIKVPKVAEEVAKAYKKQQIKF